MNVFELLLAPKRTQRKIQRLEAKKQALEYSLLPGAIRYDTDKVQASPSDQMSERVTQIEGINEEIRSLKEIYLREIEEIERVCEGLTGQEGRPDDDGSTVLIMYYVGNEKMEDIADQIGYAVSYVYKIRKRAQRELSAKINAKDKKDKKDNFNCDRV